MKSLFVANVVLMVCVVMTAWGSEPPTVIRDSEVEFFETKVRPLLAQYCFECHSSDKKQQAGLLLDSRESLLKGGETGPAIIPRNASESLLIKSVRHEGDFAMPPDLKLSEQQITVLEKWVAMGAPFSQEKAPVAGIEHRLTQAKNHWAFLPLSRAKPPEVKNMVWVQNDIDRFVLAKLELANCEVSPEVDRVTLIRRVTFDLLGLPPTPEEVAVFVNDKSPQAYELLLDRLLESPHYGERWGRHWLDLARYADSCGFHNDLDRPWAWKYRDYVIRSFNDDKPYPRFVAEQLAGDEVKGADENSWIATGFCRNGPSNDDNMGKNEAAIKQYRADQLDDVIATTSTVFLGVTIGCARCHDHKTEPFTAKDYYSLLAIFNGTEEFGEAVGKKVKKGTDSKEKEDTAKQILARVETSSIVPATHIMRRGVASNVGDEVSPAVPSVLLAEPLLFQTPESDAKSSLRRLTLAEWITSTENPLTWRVLANRIWQHHFGKGIVTTSSNFGFSGTPPTHPELLDYLATQLIQNGGRWKPLHKLILMSATYRQSSSWSEDTTEHDPANSLLSRMNLRRMEAEVIRDSILAASGNLNCEIGGPGIKPRLPAELIPASQRNKWPALAKEEAKHWRRSVYIYSKRQLLMPIMELFDAPTTTDSCAVRTESVVPTQALVLMNDEFVETHAGLLAKHVLTDADNNLRNAIDRMFQLTLSRSPEEMRMQQAESFVNERETHGDRISAMTDLAHVLFNSSEFIYIP